MCDGVKFVLLVNLDARLNVKPQLSWDSGEYQWVAELCDILLVSEQSEGQQQRGAITRAMVSQPKFLLLDEPTSALDSEYTSEVLAVLNELKQQEVQMILATYETVFACHACEKQYFCTTVYRWNEEKAVPADKNYIVIEEYGRLKVKNSKNTHRKTVAKYMTKIRALGQPPKISTIRNFCLFFFIRIVEIPGPAFLLIPPPIPPKLTFREITKKGKALKPFGFKAFCWWR